MYNLGCCYYHGVSGMPQDKAKAVELHLKAGELGCAESYGNVGNAYALGDSAEQDMKKAEHYFELAAIGGNVYARGNLGGIEQNRGNLDRAIKHWTIAAGCGLVGAVNCIQKLYEDGLATKDDYLKALRAYQTN